ncbi:hypothetical protein PENTCL1PPCAC_16777, partial [Pristionchus entomophagus]
FLGMKITTRTVAIARAAPKTRKARSGTISFKKARCGAIMDPILEKVRAKPTANDTHLVGNSSDATIS